MLHELILIFGYINQDYNKYELCLFTSQKI